MHKQAHLWAINSYASLSPALGMFCITSQSRHELEKGQNNQNKTQEVPIDVLSGANR